VSPTYFTWPTTQHTNPVGLQSQPRIRAAELSGNEPRFGIREGADRCARILGAHGRPTISLVVVMVCMAGENSGWMSHYFQDSWDGPLLEQVLGTLVLVLLLLDEGMCLV
jgi:hypothetical protein